VPTFVTKMTKKY